VNTHADTFVLRHHCCPHCAVLFEVEMVPRVAD
jgi:acetone carboxylase gamma subunit